MNFPRQLSFFLLFLLILTAITISGTVASNTLNNQPLLDDLVNQGNKAQMDNNPEKALEYFYQAVETSIVRADVYAGIGFALDSLGQHENATQYLNKALEIDPAFEPAINGLNIISERIEIENQNNNQIDDKNNLSLCNEFVNLGNKAQMDNNPERALDYFFQALETGIVRADVHAGIGFALDSLGHHENATQYMNRALEIDPEFDPAITWLQNKEKSTDNMNESSIITQNNITLCNELVNNGNNAQKEGRYEEAISYFFQAIETGIDRPDIYAGIGFALQDLGQLENATQYINKALEIDPEFNPAITWLQNKEKSTDNMNESSIITQNNITLCNELVNNGNNAQKEGRFEEAISYFFQAMETGFDRPDIYAGIGFALQDLGQLENATQYINRALEIDPEFSPALTWLQNKEKSTDNLNGSPITEQKDTSQLEEVVEKGNNALLKGNWEEALDYYFQVLNGGIIRADVYQGMGLAYKNLGQYDNATEYLNKTLELKPDAKPSIKALNEINEHKKLGIVLTYIQDPVKNSQYDELIKKGNKAHGEGNFNEAIDYFFEALNTGISRADAYGGIGLSLKNLRQYDNATIYLNKALVLKPTFEPAKIGLRQISEEREKVNLTKNSSSEYHTDNASTISTNLLNKI